MHVKQDKSFLGLEINPNIGYGTMEINESKIISSSSEIYWIFGLVDHITKEARIFTVLNNRPIIS